MMETVDEDHCKCPKCGTEVWYEYSDPEPDEISDLMQECYETHNQTTILMGGAVKLGGGSKNGKSNKKQLMKKLPNSEIYKRLAASSNPILKPPGRPKKAVDI
jgi:hypothetical protein